MEQYSISSTSGCSSRHSFYFISNTPVSDLPPLFFLRRWKLISFTLPFLLSLYSPRLYQDWYLRYWPSFAFSSHTHFAIIHSHIIHANLYVTWLVSVYEYMVINFFNLFGHYKSPPFHSVICIHLISLSYHIVVILPTHFSSIDQMLMLMLYRGLIIVFTTIR